MEKTTTASRDAIERALLNALPHEWRDIRRIGDMLHAAGHLDDIEGQDTDASSLGEMAMKYAVALLCEFPEDKLGSFVTHFFDMPLVLGQCSQDNRVVWAKVSEVDMPQGEMDGRFGEIIGRMVYGVFHGNWSFDRASKIHVTLSSDSTIDIVMGDGHRKMCLTFAHETPSLEDEDRPFITMTHAFDDRLIYVFDDLMDDLDGLRAEGHRLRMAAIMARSKADKHVTKADNASH